MIGRIVGWSLRSRGVVLAAAEVEQLITVPLEQDPAQRRGLAGHDPVGVHPRAPAARQLKYYANGVGNVRVGWAGREEKEVLELTRVAQLGPTAWPRCAETC